MDHKTVVPEWPDVIKAKIAEAREHFAAFKAEMGCPDSDLVVYGTVVSSFEAEEHERKLFKTPLQFRLARTSSCHTGQIAVTTLLKGTFEELPKEDRYGG